MPVCPPVSPCKGASIGNRCASYAMHKHFNAWKSLLCGWGTCSLRMETHPLWVGNVPFTDGNAAARTFGRAHRRRPYHFSCGSMSQGAGRGSADGLKREKVTGRGSADGLKQEKVAGRGSADGQKREKVGGRGSADGLNRKKVAGKQFADGLNRKKVAGKQFADGQTQEMYGGELFADGLNRKKVAGEQFADGLNQGKLRSRGVCWRLVGAVPVCPPVSPCKGASIVSRCASCVM